MATDISTAGEQQTVTRAQQVFGTLGFHLAPPRYVIAVVVLAASNRHAASRRDERRRENAIFSRRHGCCPEIGAISGLCFLTKRSPCFDLTLGGRRDARFRRDRASIKRAPYCNIFPSRRGGRLVTGTTVVRKSVRRWLHVVVAIVGEQKRAAIGGDYRQGVDPIRSWERSRPRPDSGARDAGEREQLRARKRFVCRTQARADTRDRGLSADRRG